MIKLNGRITDSAPYELLLDRNRSDRPNSYLGDSNRFIENIYEVLCKLVMKSKPSSRF